MVGHRPVLHCSITRSVVLTSYNENNFASDCVRLNTGSNFGAHATRRGSVMCSSPVGFISTTSRTRSSDNFRNKFGILIIQWHRKDNKLNGRPMFMEKRKSFMCSFNLFKVKLGSGFYQFSCILGNMSCLCLPCHIIQLALQKKNGHGIFFYVLKYRFPSSQSVYFGEITRVMRHICIFSRDIFSPPIFS